MATITKSIEDFRKIEEAIKYNASTSISYARSQTKNILKIFHDGDSIEIIELNIVLTSLSDYKEWKNENDFLNYFNSDMLIQEIERESISQQSDIEKNRIAVSNIKIVLDEFVKANLLKLESDVTQIFRVVAKSGYVGHMYQLNKTPQLGIQDALSILIGRAACILEEWNYNSFSKIDWGNFFKLDQNLSNYMVNNFLRCSNQIFLDSLNKFIASNIQLPENYKRKVCHAFIGEFVFDGSNKADMFLKHYRLNAKEIKNYQPIYGSEIKNSFRVKGDWNYELFFAELDAEYILFENSLTT